MADIANLVQGLTGGLVAPLVGFGANAGVSLSLAGGHVNVPSEQHASRDEYVSHNRTAHYISRAGSKVYAPFVNANHGQDSQGDGDFDFNIIAYVRVNGVWHQMTATDGSGTNPTLAKEHGIVTMMADVAVTEGVYMFYTRKVATNDSLGSYTHNTTVNTSFVRGEGAIYTTDPTLNLAVTPNAVANGAEFGAVTVDGSGEVTAVAVDAGGQGYTAAPSVSPYYGPAGVGALNAIHPATTAFAGFANRTANVVTSVGISNAGAGQTTANPPEMFINGQNTLATGFGTNSRAYGPTAIMVEPTEANKPTVFVLGDSYEAGGGGTTGTLDAQYSMLERILGKTFGYGRIAINGESAAGFNLNNDKLWGIFDHMVTQGLKTSEINFVAISTINDWQAGAETLVPNTLAQLNTIAGDAKSRGVNKVFALTVPPSTTTTDAWATTVNQTEVNANYESGGDVETYNDSLRSLTSVSNVDGVIELGGILREAGTPWAWKTDATYPYAADNGGADIGIHPTADNGEHLIVNRLAIPDLTPVPHASSLITDLDVVKTNSITVVSGEISQINDQTGNSNHGIQDSVSRRIPYGNSGYMGGYHALNCNSAKNVYVDGLAYDHTNVACFALFRPSAVSGLAVLAADTDLGANTPATRSWRFQLTGNNGDLLLYTYTSAATPVLGTVATSSYNITNNKTYLGAFHFIDGDVYFIMIDDAGAINQFPVQTANTTTLNTTTRGQIGVGCMMASDGITSATQAFPGSIGRFMMAENITNAQYLDIAKHLAFYWNLTNTLPGYGGAT